ncbi:MAG: type 1 glutamine amidotransferase domain-containing protein [Gammaproteobacteria bacterium]|nr:type 1 glutamine amidotransferase domain-containing protein [Gammaproteobacteria bacterium]
MKILMVLTSHDRLGDTGDKTGFWLEELAAPYYVFTDAGAEVALASPAGGAPPQDPKSDAPDMQTDAIVRFKADNAACAALAATLKLADINAGDYDAVFYPGGHGPLWDLAGDADSVALIEAMHRDGKPVAAVCHGPCVLLRATTPDGSPLVRGCAVTGFSNTEEDAAGLTDAVPFLVEDELRRLGGRYTKAADWQVCVAVEGNLVTGQNPASSSSAADEVLKQLARQQGG